MLDRTGTLSLNPNPLAFEELVTSLASLMAYLQDGMTESVEEFQRLFRQALRHPASYAEITELTGEALSPADRRAGRVAWLLMNVESLEVYGVHSLVWHKTKGDYSAPMLDQLSRALNLRSSLSEQDKERLRTTTLPLDVVGIKDGAIWLVQGVHETDLADSAVVATRRKSRLFRGSVFEDVSLGSESLATLQSAHGAVQAAFPNVPCHVYALVIHPHLPDFELYHLDRVELRKRSGQPLALNPSHIKTNSVDHQERLQQDHDSLWTLAKRFDNALFRGLPPCRGGRTLAILASVAKRQLETTDLLSWKEADVSEMLMNDFDYIVPRDKVRHDLVDRLVGQQFMRKRGSDYHLTVKGIARYEYCLAKYTTKGIDNPMDVLDLCSAHRNKIITRYGCL